MNLVKLPEFLLCQNRGELKDAALIVQIEHPFLIGRVVYYKSVDEMIVGTTGPEVYVFAAVDGYSIAIQFAGTFPVNKMAVETNMKRRDTETMKRMAAFFKIQRLDHRPGYYNRRYLVIKQ